MLIAARLLYLLFNVNCRRTFNAPIYWAKNKRAELDPDKHSVVLFSTSIADYVLIDNRDVFKTVCRTMIRGNKPLVGTIKSLSTDIYIFYLDDGYISKM